MITQLRNVNLVIGTVSPPPIGTPNARSHSGVRVHRTVWELVHGRWLAYPVCHAATQTVLPGKWTYDAVTCKNCLCRARGGLIQPKTRTPHSIVKLKVQLWTEVTKAVADLASDARRLFWSTDPASQARVLRIIELYRQLRDLVLQCSDPETLEIARMFIAPYRADLLDVFLEEITDRP